MARKFNLTLTFAGALVLVLLIVVWLRLPGAAPADGTTAPVGLTVGLQAPAISGETLEGQVVHLSDHRGQPVLVNIFATWCGPCQIEMPHLVEIFAENQASIQVIGINLQENPAAVAEFRQAFDIPFPLILDPQGELTEIYRPVGLPTTWFIDPQGIIRYVHIGPLTVDLLREAIEATRAGQNYNPFGS